jgi:hypothetical protein
VASDRFQSIDTTQMRRHVDPGVRISPGSREIISGSRGLGRIYSACTARHYCSRIPCA